MSHQLVSPLSVIHEYRGKPEPHLNAGGRAETALAKEAAGACEHAYRDALHLIARMVDAVKHRHVAEVERINTIQAGNIEPKLGRIGTPLMMGVDATNGTKEMPRRASAECVLGEHVCAVEDLKIVERHRRCDCSTASAHGAVAATRVNKAIRQSQLKPHGATVAGRLMNAFDLHQSTFPCRCAGISMLGECGSKPPINLTGMRFLTGSNGVDRSPEASTPN